MDEKEAQVKDEFTEKMEAAALENPAAPAEDPSSEAGQPEAQPNTEQPSEERSEGGIFDAEKQEADLNSPSPNSSDEVFPPAGDVLPSSEEGKAEAERDFAAEWRELAEAHPEVVGKELPEDIYRACMESELSPLRVYETMMLTKQAEEIESLRKEIATLRQNAETAARAPVSAVSDYGGSTEPEDLFARSFKSY